MDGYDMNWWGVYAMPVGLAICFGPILVAWALAECKQPAKAPQKKKK